MLADLLKRLKGDADNTPLAIDDARLAVAALLVIAANADGVYADAERAQIEQVLSARYGLAADAARKLRTEGEAAEAVAMDLFKFTALIKRFIAYEERASILEAMWRVVLTDARRDKDEDMLMRRVTDLLGLDWRDAVEARQRVQAA